MKIQIRVLISFLVLAGSVSVILLSSYGFRSWFNASAVTDWIVSSEEKDTTDRHRQNMEESYQILPDHILLKPEKGEHMSHLVRLDRYGKMEQVVTERDVDSFLEIDQKVYYKIWKDYDEKWQNDIDTIYSYDYTTGKHTLVTEGTNIDWFSIYQDQLVYVCSDTSGCMDQVFSCQLNGQSKKKIYQFEGKLYGEQFVLTDDRMILFYDTEDSYESGIGMLSLQGNNYKCMLVLDGSPWKSFFLGQRFYIIDDNKLFQIALDLQKGRADKTLLSENEDYENIVFLCGRGDNLYSTNYDREFALIFEGGNP